MSHVRVHDIAVAEPLHRFLEEEALPGSGVDPERFWEGAAAVVRDFTPLVAALLAERDRMQGAIDDYHRESGHLEAGGRPDPADYERFLRDLGYLVDEPADFEISSHDVDPEVAGVAGPQLVVPLLNARFAINAANARWGSLYDALYGTDVIDEDDGRERGADYNPVRGQAVVALAREFLDSSVPLAAGSHADATGYYVRDRELVVDHESELGGVRTGLVDAGAFAGYAGDPAAPTAILLRHHGLHIEIAIDRSDPVGAADRAGVRDVSVEAAVTTIMDLEDSVAAVDPDDKVHGYRNWLRLMQGTLTADVTKGGRTFTRTLEADREYVAPDGGELVLPGRALLFVRQVGHLMTTDAIRLVTDGHPDGVPTPEGVVDALVTTLCSLHDLREMRMNSRSGSMYAVKPKLHGPEEVAVTDELFARMEDLVGLDRGTIKLGLMDEERRTSANLKACIAAAQGRIAFVNTGFLDRTGDEIHTSMLAGPMVRKGEMRSQPWIDAYERSCVHTALACGFAGRAQVGKGMWAAPDSMAQMLREKGGQLRAGASCAWVPSPTAATLHAIHYHRVDVAARQRELHEEPRPSLTQLLTIPLGDPSTLTAEEVETELRTNLQSALGYIVRWVEEGVGCSKVPDLDGVQLMEDRATCRISTQHVANWLHHGVVTPGQVEVAMAEMARVVDEQNAGDPAYRPMTGDPDSEAYAAVRDLVFDGLAQPSGYTEPVLHRRRLVEKQR